MIQLLSEVIEESMDVINVVLDYMPDEFSWMEGSLMTGLYYLHTVWEWLGNG